MFNLTTFPTEVNASPIYIRASSNTFSKSEPLSMSTEAKRKG